MWEAWQDERRHLAPLPILPQPFDLVATRQVGDDARVNFEGRQYSLPFAWIGREVEVRGTAGQVQILADYRIVAEHPRHTAHRLNAPLDPAAPMLEAAAAVGIEPAQEARRTQRETQW